MQIASIVPPALLHDVLGGEDRYHLILTDLVRQNPTYREFYKDRIRRGDFVLLDAMAYEQPASSSVDDLCEAIELLMSAGGPTVVTLPDRRDYSYMENVELSAHCAALLAARFGRRVRFSAVPHGRSIAEYERAVDMLAGVHRVVCMGVAFKMNVPLTPRPELVRLVRRRVGQQKMIHAYGMTEHMMDLLDPVMHQECIGVDSVKLVQWGFEGKEVTPETHVMPKWGGRPSGYFDLTGEDVREDRVEQARANIKAWRQFVQPGVLR